jgi:hypothetical protein
MVTTELAINSNVTLLVLFIKGFKDFTLGEFFLYYQNNHGHKSKGANSKVSSFSSVFTNKPPTNYKHCFLSLKKNLMSLHIKNSLIDNYLLFSNFLQVSFHAL